MKFRESPREAGGSLGGRSDRIGEICVPLTKTPDPGLGAVDVNFHWGAISILGGGEQQNRGSAVVFNGTPRCSAIG